MARRSAPPGSGPAYISKNQAALHGRGKLPDPDESSFSRFMREEVWAPEKLPGNISFVTGIGLFAAGVFAVRNWGDMLIPA
ncbi:hypothetical protein VKT23_008216 [Stygiomarasmius scandens]|uniref:Uncharacterized protein n=1 Tax=Marasmiellus scandens TaxID=2682957 RepID=A0ABR1JK36_9AGAR